MPIRQFDLYDVIVDTIPGFFAVGMIVFIAPNSFYSDIKSIPSTLLGGITLIIISFVLGRTVHALSGSLSTLIEKTLNSQFLSLEEATYNRNISEAPIAFLFKNIRKSIPVEQGDPIIELMIRDGRTPTELLEEGSEVSISSELPTSLLANRVYYRFVESHDLPIDAETKLIKRFGYSRLYSEGHLYQRYNILSTFFRNMSFLFWIFTLITLVQLILYANAYSILGIGSLWLSLDIGGFLPLTSILFAVIFSRETYKFSGRRNLHFLIDYYIELREKAENGAD